MLRTIALTLTLLILSGCKLAVILVEGGEVQSTSSGTCVVATPGVTGSVCIHDVIDTAYSESFTAVPDTGWEFVKWNSGSDFFCEDSTNATCVVDNTLLAGIAGAETVVASDQAFYIMPIFQQLPQTVVVDGKEWLQPHLFFGVSWNDISAVCDPTTGTCSGSLNGQDLTGWTWADDSEAAELFNYFIGSEFLPIPNFYEQSAGETAVEDFFAAGFIKGSESGDPPYVGSLRGLMRYRSLIDPTQVGDIVVTDYYPNFPVSGNYGVVFFRFTGRDIDETAPDLGAYFFRAP